MHSHFVALVEFHTSGDQTMVSSLHDKLKSLSGAEPYELSNLIPIYEKV